MCRINQQTWASRLKAKLSIRLVRGALLHTLFTLALLYIKCGFVHMQTVLLMFVHPIVVHEIR